MPITGWMLLCTLCVGPLVTSVAAQEWTKPHPARPRYLLVLQYLGNVYESAGVQILYRQGLVTRSETYETLEQVEQRLREPMWDEQSVVGLWELTPKNQLEVKTWTTTRTIPEHIKEQKKTERHWEIRR